MNKTFYIEHLGCAKNQVDGEVMAGALLRAGWTQTSEPVQANYLLVNTCGFIRSAQEESINVLLETAQGTARVVATGCLSQRWGKSLRQNIPELAGCFGNRWPEAIVAFLEEKLPRGEVVWLPEATGADTGTAYSQRPLHGFPFSAYVKISEGCDHRCAYCAIPLIRGNRRDRPKDDVLAEVKSLLSRGVREINLVAHDLASYGPGLVSLVRDLEGWDGDWWLRLLYIYPENFPWEILDLIRGGHHLVPYLDIPFQHGSDAVLRRMGRPGRRGAYLDLVKRIRDEVPEAALRTTFITGYRGETEGEFEELLTFQAAIQAEWAGIFAYSPEEGTPADKAGVALGKLPAKLVVLARKAAFEKAQQTITAKALASRIGSKTRLLVEEHVADSHTVLARVPIQAPDVDGLTLALLPPPLPPTGSFREAVVEAVNGVDFAATSTERRDPLR